jgi:drug/metabolite transporter (DMT)-like permease
MRMLGTAMGLAAAVMSSGSYLAIRRLGQAEKAPVIAMAFHTATLALAVGPLVAGWPQQAVLPSAHDGGLLLGVAATSFFAQLLLTRSLQRTAAALVSGVSFSQVRRRREPCLECSRAGAAVLKAPLCSCLLLTSARPATIHKCTVSTLSNSTQTSHTQVIYSFALSSLFFHQTLGLTSAAGVLLTLCGVALVVLRHGPRVGSTAGPPLRPQSLAEQVLKKQASAACQAAAAAQQQLEVPSSGGVTGEPAGSGAAAGLGRAFSAQRSLRALSSLRAASAELISEGGPVAAAAAAPMRLLHQLSVAASAQLDSVPTMSAADLAVAAEGVCSASTAALIAASAAYEAFGGGGGAAQGAAGGPGPAASRSDAAAAAVAAAVEQARAIVAAAFAGDLACNSVSGSMHGEAAATGAGLILAEAGAAAAAVLVEDEAGSERCSCDGAREVASWDSGGRRESGGTGPGQRAPRISSHLSGSLDRAG